MSIDREKQIYLLKKQKDFLEHRPENVLPATDSKGQIERDHFKSTGKALELRQNPNVRYTEESSPFMDRKNGFTNACMLGLITFLCETAFLIVSYFLFR